MKKALSEVCRIRKRVARDKQFSSLGCNLIARLVEPADDTELFVQLKKQTNEAQENLGGYI